MRLSVRFGHVSHHILSTDVIWLMEFAGWCSTADGVGVFVSVYVQVGFVDVEG